MRYYSKTYLNLSSQGLTELPDDIHLYTNLIDLHCNNNLLTSLPENLPSSLNFLDCSHNQLTYLPDNLPSSLKVLHCKYNQLTFLPENIPPLLKSLVCYNNQLTSLPENLPNSIIALRIMNNKITDLPYNLPSSLQPDHPNNELDCWGNPFYDELDYKLTIETLPRFIEERNSKMFDYVLK
jgi:Leucine-rich repeat (LRR) protein